MPEPYSTRLQWLAQSETQDRDYGGVEETFEGERANDTPQEFWAKVELLSSSEGAQSGVVVGQTTARISIRGYWDVRAQDRLRDKYYRTEYLIEGKPRRGDNETICEPCIAQLAPEADHRESEGGQSDG